MKEIGGYFELELTKKEEFHNAAIKLNSGRNAFKYILKAQNIKKVYMPYFVCNSVIEPLAELNISYEFYNIDGNFEIVKRPNVKENEKLFYINYFSLKTAYMASLVDIYSSKLIIDNTQAFFEKPMKNIDTIYSPRKFFGVSDGGYLYTNHYLDQFLEKDVSSYSSRQLLGRIDKSATLFYADYQKSEERLANQSIKKMSNLTQKILSSIEYKRVSEQRKENFEFLHNRLKSVNLLKIDTVSSVPFVYLFMTNNKELRKSLVINKIYVARYWSEVLIRKNITRIEKEFIDRIIPLPIDQRYDSKDMKRIVDIVKGCI
jgi:hypothetical protein